MHMIQVIACPYGQACWCGGESHPCFVTSNNKPEWHRLGHNRGRKFTVEEAWHDIHGYEVEERLAYFLNAQGIYEKDPTRKVLVRPNGDRDIRLGSVGAGYHAVQFNRLLKLLESALPDASKADSGFLDTCGLLGSNGERMFAAVDLGEFGVTRGDTIKRYLLLLSANDGSASVIFRRCSTRPVCNNTVTAAMGERTPFEVKIRHTAGAAEALKDLEKALRRDSTFADEQKAGCQYLASREVKSEAEMDALISEILILPKDQEEPSAQLKNNRLRIKALAEGEADGVSAHKKRTRWDLFNATTQWVDRERRISGGVRELDTVLNRHAQILRNRAWNVLTTSEPEVDKILVGVG